MEKIWKSQWRGQILFSHGQTNAKGCAILINKTVKTEVIKTHKSDEGRFLIVQIKINNFEYVLCNLYAPNEDSPEFFVNVFSEVEKFKCGNLIIAGDFNTVLNSID